MRRDLPASRPLARRTLIAGSAALALAACIGPVAPRHAAAAPKVLFVCQFGSVKSPVARELLRRRGAERSVAVSVQSRGITPGGHQSPALVAALHTEGLNTLADPLRPLTASDLAQADVVIVFDRLPAGMAASSVRDWSDLPSMNAEYPRARTILVERIDRLLDEFAAGRSERR
jgi:protein-tyrosine-phosphatase